jgi:hypothetical protein
MIASKSTRRPFLVHHDMSRSPACLQYLAIYNPTLDPVKIEGDEYDEDAEEQAHILFYTSKERAVSRDRMLRQIGLTKALVNFSGSVYIEAIMEMAQIRRF